MFARGVAADRRGGARQVLDELRAALRLGLWRERACALDPLEPRVRDQRGEPLGVLTREELVIRRPRDQRRLVPGRELRRCVERVDGVEPAEHAADVAADIAACQHGQDVGVLGVRVDRLVREPAERDREPAQRAEAEPAERHRDHAGHLRRRQRDPEQARREVVERVAGGEHERADPVGPGRGRDLGERAGGVVADQDHVAEVERLERVGDHAGERGRAQVGALRHRFDVRAEREVERHAREALEARDDLPPQVRVHEHAVREHDHWSLARHVRADPAPTSEVHHLGRPQLVRAPGRSIAHLIRLHTGCMPGNIHGQC